MEKTTEPTSCFLFLFLVSEASEQKQRSLKFSVFNSASQTYQTYSAYCTHMAMTETARATYSRYVGLTAHACITCRRPISFDIRHVLEILQISFIG